MTPFHPARIGNSGRVSLLWGRPCATAAEARRVGKAEVDAGRATLSFVAAVDAAGRTPIARLTYPEAAQKIIRHWEELWDATEGDR